MIRTIICLSFPFLATASIARAAPEPRAVILEQLVAAKEVCAWPKLALAANGDVIAAIYNRPTHGAQPGDVEIHASTDGAPHFPALRTGHRFLHRPSQ